MQPVPSPAPRLFSIFAATLWLTVLLGAVLLARHNVRASRADRRGAARLAGVYITVQLVAWLLGAHHLASVAEVNSLFRVLGNVLFAAALLWVLYLALEPYGRRFWPDGLLGWTRLFSGRVRDPRIGGEIVIGAALGGVLMSLDLLRSVAPYLIGQPAGAPSVGRLVSALSGPGALALGWVNEFYSSVQTALVVTLLFVGLRLLVRYTWIAVAIGSC